MNDRLLTYIRHVLTAPLTITGAEHWSCPCDKVGFETIVWFPKILLVTNGTIQYEIDNQTLHVGSGDILYRPAWTRSKWHSASRRPLRLAFCEFDIPVAGAMWREPFVIHASDPDRESATLRRIKLLRDHNSATSILEAAGELKALLSRIFATLAQQRREMPPKRPSVAQGALDRALEHIEKHYVQPNVLKGLHGKIGLGINRFRSTFHQRLGISPHEYVTTLRMRAARYYLTDSRMAVKQLASALGYTDPLYFSRVYRRFWGHPPTNDRNMPAAGARPPVLKNPPRSRIG